MLYHERARLRGYPNQATFEMEGNIIQHPSDARSLLAKFQERVVQTSALKSAVEAKRNEDQTQVAEYFPLEPTLRRVLSTLGSLFGIVFKRIKDDFWHEDVQLYAIWDNEELRTFREV